MKLDGVRVTRDMRQEIVDEMMVRLAMLLPQEYRGEYEKVTGFEKKYTQECTITLENLT